MVMMYLCQNKLKTKIILISSKGSNEPHDDVDSNAKSKISFIVQIDTYR